MCFVNGIWNGFEWNIFWLMFFFKKKEKIMKIKKSWLLWNEIILLLKMLNLIVVDGGVIEYEVDE